MQGMCLRGAADVVRRASERPPPFRRLFGVRGGLFRVGAKKGNRGAQLKERGSLKRFLGLRNFVLRILEEQVKGGLTT